MFQFDAQIARRKTNYWGYSPISSALHQAYIHARSAQGSEFRDMVAFAPAKSKSSRHCVNYAEGEHGNTLFRGSITNLLSAGSGGARYSNYRCGNAEHQSSDRARMIVDSLRY